MFIYDNLKEMEENSNLAVSPMAYVILECAR